MVVCVTAKVICHPVMGKSKGYRLVKFSSENEAAAALEKMSDEVMMCSTKLLEDNTHCSVQFFS